MDTLYVGFRHSDKWVRHFLKKGYAHCFVLLPFKNGWLEVDPLRGILYFNEKNDTDIARYTKILRVDLNGYKCAGFPLKIFTCVNMVEYMLGKRMYSITPHRLYKNLIGKYKEYFNTREIV